MILGAIGAPAAILLDNARTRVRTVDLAAGDTLGGAPEAALAVASGGGAASADGIGETAVAEGDLLHLPSARAWSFRAQVQTRLLVVESRHPALRPGGNLMPQLEAFDRVSVADNKRFRYTDWFRGGMIVLPGGEGVPKHFHEGADEVFWFTGGSFRLEWPGGSRICRPGDIVVFEALEWHLLENASAREPASLYFTVTPNVVPSHTYFRADGTTYPRSLEPLISA